MRIVTDKYRAELLKNKVYQMIVNTPRPDFARLRKDADEFETWIAGVHEKERSQRLARCTNVV